MDFGVTGYDGLVGSDTTGFTSDPVTKQKWYGSSGLLKQERSGNINIEDDWRSSKVAKAGHHNNHDGGGSGDAMLLPQQRNSNNSSLLRSNTISFDHGQHHQNMLSFSSPKSDVVSVEKGSENPALPYYHLTSPAYTRTAGYNCGRMSVGGSMHGVLLAGGRGAFTPSQWMELEHQALIYKYINSNMPIPSNLLIPIRKALESAAFSGLSASILRPNTLGWGPFHLGFSGSADPEPGRCRRTDGKKWRCSRDAVADQKYCERHMNRGRHRSRKPVEGQSGHSVAATSTTSTSKLNTTTTTSSSSVVVMPPTGGSGGSAASGNLTAADQQRHQQQLKNLHHRSGAPINRMSLSGDNLEDGKREGLFVMSKQQYPVAESSHSEFGLVSSDSLLNPSQSSSLLSCRKFGSSQCQESQHSVRQFMDGWPKIDMQSDRTQLSISIPATSPPNNNEKLTLSPLRLSHDFDPIQMGLGVGSVLGEQNQRQANWIPISWESSMGGPLGEVLKNTNNNNSSNSNRVMECKNSSALNLMTEGWDNSPRLSPTGVLQKTAFGSLSNSSAGSSPRAENNKTSEGASLCNDLLG